MAAERWAEHDTAVDPRSDTARASRALARLERLAAGRGGPALVGLWAFAEAIVLPVVPDVALGLLVLVAPRRALVLFGWLIAASLAGTAVLFLAATFAPDAVTAVILALPGIPASMLQDARAAVAAGDPTALALFGPGTPLKVYTLAWALGPGTILPLAAGAIINRVTRIGPGLVALAVLGRVAPDLLRRHERLVFVAYAAFWVALYVAYLGWGPGKEPG